MKTIWNFLYKSKENNFVYIQKEFCFNVKFCTVVIRQSNLRFWINQDLTLFCFLLLLPNPSPTLHHNLNPMDKHLHPAVIEELYFFLLSFIPLFPLFELEFLDYTVNHKCWNSFYMLYFWKVFVIYILQELYLSIFYLMQKS